MEDGTPLAAEDYEILNERSSILYRETGWRSTQLHHLDIETHPADRSNFEWFVEYTAGYITRAMASNDSEITLPFDIERACIDLVRSWYKRRGENPSLASERIGRASRSFAGVGSDDPKSAYPPTVRRAIDKHSETVIL